MSLRVRSRSVLTSYSKLSLRLTTRDSLRIGVADAPHESYMRPHTYVIMTQGD